MKFLTKSLFFFFCTITIGLTLIVPQESEEQTKRIEKKWGMEDSDDKLVIKKKVQSENFVPIFLSQFQPVKQEFSINPSMENVILGKYGTKITIPANSISPPYGYKRGSILTLELIEIYNDLDFITSPISLEYFNPDPHIFESGGMFKLSGTYYDKPLSLKRGVKLKVEMPRLIYSDKKMKMYKFDEREGWVEKGELSNSEPVNNIETFDKVSNSVFKFMDDFKWWNADYPNPDTTCLEGKIIPFVANPPYSITTVGIDYKNAASRYADNLKFQINAIKGKRVKLIAMDSKGNIGVSQELNTGNMDAFLKTGEKSKCTEVAVIKIEKISRDILKDRQKLLSYLGLYDIISP